MSTPQSPWPSVEHANGERNYGLDMLAEAAGSECASKKDARARCAAAVARVEFAAAVAVECAAVARVECATAALGECAAAAVVDKWEGLCPFTRHIIAFLYGECDPNEKLQKLMELLCAEVECRKELETQNSKLQSNITELESKITELHEELQQERCKRSFASEQQHCSGFAMCTPMALAAIACSGESSDSCLEDLRSSSKESKRKKNTEIISADFEKIYAVFMLIKPFLHASSWEFKDTAAEDEFWTRYVNNHNIYKQTVNNERRIESARKSLQMLGYQQHKHQRLKWSWDCSRAVINCYWGDSKQPKYDEYTKVCVQALGAMFMKNATHTAVPDHSDFQFPEVSDETIAASLDKIFVLHTNGLEKNLATRHKAEIIFTCECLQRFFREKKIVSLRRIHLHDHGDNILHQIQNGTAANNAKLRLQHKKKRLQ
jgi:hypothetical protein